MEAKLAVALSSFPICQRRKNLQFKLWASCDEHLHSTLQCGVQELRAQALISAAIGGAFCTSALASGPLHQVEWQVLAKKTIKPLRACFAIGQWTLRGMLPKDVKHNISGKRGITARSVLVFICAKTEGVVQPREVDSATDFACQVLIGLQSLTSPRRGGGLRIQPRIRSEIFIAIVRAGI